MGFVVNPSGIESYTFRFTGAQMQTCGTIPLTLPVNFFVVSEKVFIPVVCNLILQNTSIPFDFGAADHITIQNQGSASNLFKWFDPIQNISDNRPFVAIFQQRTHNSVTMSPDTQYTGGPTIITTATGNDATQGDSDVVFYITGFWQYLT